MTDNIKLQKDITELQITLVKLFILLEEKNVISDDERNKTLRFDHDKPYE